MIEEDELPERYLDLVWEYEIDLDEINEWIRIYEPVVRDIDVDYFNRGISVYVEDVNDNLPGFWIDFWQDGSSIGFEWNEYITNLNYSGDFVWMLCKNDYDVYSPAMDLAYGYLRKRGYIVNENDGERLVYEPHLKRPVKSKSVKRPTRRTVGSNPVKKTPTKKKARPVKSENNPKSPTKRKNTVQPKSSAKTKETTATKKRSGKK